MPVRTIKRTYLSLTGYFYSILNERLMAFESPHERDYFFVLEFDRDVESYEEQPLAIESIVDGKKRTYYPDVLVYFKPETGRKDLLVEVKSVDELSREKGKDGENLKLKLSACESYSRQHGMDFKVITDDDMKKEHNLSNLKLLYHHVRRKPKDLESQRIIILNILREGPLKIVELVEKLSPDKFKQAAALPSMWHMLYEGSINADLKKPLTNDSILEISNGQDKA